MRLPPALLLAWLALLALPTPALASTVRLLVSIGANVGDPEDPPLRYADDDARRVRELFVELGDVRQDRAYLVVNKPADEVRRRLAEVAGRIAELRASGNDVVLLLYVSAHASGGNLHLHGTHLPLTELRDFASNTGARLRVLMVDACESGTIARRKGGSAGPAYAVSLESLPLNGQVIISSSGPAEASEEWESLQGSLFTHHLLTGLRGDADGEGDGRVTLAEAYAYAFRRTVASAASTRQRPAFDLDVSGTGELVLSQPAVARSALIFPAPLQGYYVVASRPRADVVAEVEKTAGKEVRLAVPPGRYLVRKRQGRSTGLLEVELPYGGERRLQESELAWRDYTEVAMKGGVLEVRPWSVFALASVQSAPVAGTSARLQGGLGVRAQLGEWWSMATLTGGVASYRGVRLDIHERALTVGATAGYRWLSWTVIPTLGVSVEVSGLEQSFLRDDEATIRRMGGAPLPNAGALGLAAGPALGLEVPLPGTAFLLLQTSALVRYLPSSTQPSLGVGLQGFLATGLKF